MYLDNYHETGGFTVKNTDTSDIVLHVSTETTPNNHQTYYPFCATSQKYTVQLFSTTGSLKWERPNGSQPLRLFVQLHLSGSEYETISRLHYDQEYLNLPDAHTFSIEYAVSPLSQWYYKYENVPNTWLITTDYQSWSQSTSGSFPNSSGVNQFYMKQFTIPTGGLTGISGYVLSLKYKFGCIVYLNGKEVYRYAVTGTYPNVQNSDLDAYTDIKYRQVSRPLHSWNTEDGSIEYLQEGENTIGVLLIAKDASQVESVFDCGLRLMGKEISYSRVFDFVATASEDIDDPVFGANSNDFFDMNYIPAVTSTSCSDNYVQVQFNDNRREWITSVSITTNAYAPNYPIRFTVKAKNPEDADWTTLKVGSDLTWTHYYETVRFKFVNDNSFNIYRIENIANTETGFCRWGISEMDLSSDLYTTPTLSYPNIPALSYPPIEFTVGSYSNPIYPVNDLYFGFSINPALPSGLTLNPETGAFTYTNADVFTGTFTITASKWDGQTTSATVTISVVNCDGNRDFVSVYVKGADESPAYNAFEIYAGKEASGPIVGSVRHGTEEEGTYDFCLPHGIYTIKTNNPEGNGWWMGDHYSLSVDNRGFTFFAGAIAYGIGYATNLFSSVLPFKSTTEWKFSEVSPDSWNTVGFNDDSWTLLATSDFGSSVSTTVYLRKQFNIPSLADYHVLNVQVNYTGGVVAYFNGNKVARFNLPDTFDSDTVATKYNNRKVSSTFSIILSANGASETNNVIAFEIHSGSADSHTITFSATGVYGVSDCSVLTYSTPGLKRYSFNQHDLGFSTNMFDWKNYPFVSFESSDFSGGDRIDAFADWTVDNLEGAKFNAFGFIQSQNVNPRACSFAIEHYDDNGVFTPIRTFYDEAPTRGGYYSYILSDQIVTERDIRLSQPYYCSNQSVQFGELFLEYCVSPSCPASGEYQSTLSGGKSYADCPLGFSGYKYRPCQNGVFGDEVNECVYANEIKYLEANLLMIHLNEVVEVTPSTLVPVNALSISPELPSGLTFDETTGKISGSLSTAIPETAYTITGVNEHGTTTVIVYLVVVDTDVFAVSASSSVSTLDGTAVDSIETESTAFKYYKLDYNTDYAIVDQNKAIVIGPDNSIWDYELPVLKKLNPLQTYGSSNLQVTSSQLFTHYRYRITECPSGYERVSTRRYDSIHVKYFCVPIGSQQQYLTTSEREVVLDRTGKPVKPSGGNSVLRSYTITSASPIVSSSDLIITDPENEGIVAMGPYYTWTAEEFARRMLSKLVIRSGVSTSTIMRPALTFVNKKRSLIDSSKSEFVNVMKPAAEDEDITDYAIEGGLELMEIVYYLANKRSITLSRSHLKQLISEECTSAECTNWKMVVGILRNHGVCAEGSDLTNCTPYKLQGFAQATGANKNSQWIINQIDVGNPVFVMLSLDASQLQHHTSFSPNPINNVDKSFMNFGGVVTGYNADGEEGFEYWEVMVRRHGDANNMIKVRMDLNGKNFARITNNAFTIESVSQ